MILIPSQIWNYFSWPQLHYYFPNPNQQCCSIMLKIGVSILCALKHYTCFNTLCLCVIHGCGPWNYFPTHIPNVDGRQPRACSCMHCPGLTLLWSLIQVQQDQPPADITWMFQLVCKFRIHLQYLNNLNFIQSISQALSRDPISRQHG